TGLSMGGYGTWSMAAAHPDKWAAIVPICGGGNPQSAEKIKGLPVWTFCGDKDSARILEGTRSMVKALKDAGAKDVRYDKSPGVGHNSGDRAYGPRELSDWLLMQRRKWARPAPGRRPAPRGRAAFFPPSCRRPGLAADTHSGPPPGGLVPAGPVG